MPQRALQSVHMQHPLHSHMQSCPLVIGLHNMPVYVRSERGLSDELCKQHGKESYIRGAPSRKLKVLYMRRTIKESNPENTTN